MAYKTHSLNSLDWSVLCLEKKGGIERASLVVLIKWSSLLLVPVERRFFTVYLYCIVLPSYPPLSCLRKILTEGASGYLGLL